MCVCVGGGGPSLPLITLNVSTFYREQIWLQKWILYEYVQQHVPELSGYMRLLTRNNTSGDRYSVEFLLFIDLDPKHESTIFTTLMFVINQCQKYGQNQ